MEDNEKVSNEQIIQMFSSFSNIEKVVTMFRVIGNDRIDAILPFLSRDEIEKIAKEMKKIREFEKIEALAVMGGFCKKILDLITPESPDQQSAAILSKYDELNQGKSPKSSKQNKLKNIGAMSALEDKKIFNLFKYEHSNTWAILLSQLNPEQAIRIISMLPKERQFEIFKKLAGISSFNMNDLHEFNEVLGKKMEALDEDLEYSGVKGLADILGMMTEEESISILENVKKEDESLYKYITKYFRTFKDFMGYDVSILNKVLGQFDAKVIGSAICLLPQNLIDKVKDCVTKRTWVLVVDEIVTAKKGSKKLINQAQKEIMTKLSQMEKNQEIELPEIGESKQDTEEELELESEAKSESEMENEPEDESDTTEESEVETDSEQKQ